MTSIARLKDRARKHEHKEDWEAAIKAYQKVLEAEEGEDGLDLELGLFNRIGDLYLRMGRTDDAVSYYEQAADKYADAGFTNNAIALCNKALRHRPERPHIYHKLSGLCLEQGFLIDARRWIREYADRQLRSGDVDAALEGLIGFVEASGDPDIREILAGHLASHDRQDEAVEQYGRAYRDRMERGQTEAAQKVAEKARAIDPAVDLATDPGADTAGEQPAGDDLDFERGTGPGVADVQGEPGDGADTSEDGIAGDGLEGLEVSHSEQTPEEPPVEEASLGGLETFGTVELGADEAPEATESGAGPSDLQPEGLETSDLGSEGLESEGLEPEGLEPEGLEPASLEPETSEPEGLESAELDLDAELGAGTDAVPEPEDDLGLEEGDDPEPLPMVEGTEQYQGARITEMGEVDSELDDEIDPEAGVDPDDEATDAAGELSVEGFESSDLDAGEVDAGRIEEPALDIEGFESGELDAGAVEEPGLDIEGFESGELDAGAVEEPGLDIEGFESGELDAGAVVPQAGEPSPDLDALDESEVEDPGAVHGLELDDLESDDDPNLDRDAGVGEPGLPQEAGGAGIDLDAVLREMGGGESDALLDDEGNARDPELAARMTELESRASGPEGGDAGDHYDLGLAYKEMGLIDEAIAEFQQALTGGEERLKVYEELGQCFMQKGQYTVAVKILNRALKVPRQEDSELLGVHYLLGQAHEQLGDRGAAKAAYQQVLELDPAFRDVPERLERL
ncbi:MAG TPA: tetratricopeptide repeat protein [Longimicrobiales bacterium]|nr:tetratricopeptide repeat protein [Longimicrobiales bacterium]